MAVADVPSISRDLDEACMHAVAELLQGLPLQSEESDRGDLMEAKSQLFLKYFTLFMNLLNECSDIQTNVVSQVDVVVHCVVGDGSCTKEGQASSSAASVAGGTSIASVASGLCSLQKFKAF